MPGEIYDLYLRSSENIQGDILAGFNKDYKTYLFLKFPDANRARAWLQDLVPRISTTREVAAFNERFAALRQMQEDSDPEDLKAQWVNVTFTAHGLGTLFTKDRSDELKRFSAFYHGAASHAAANGDVGLSDPRHWVVGSPNQDPVDALLTVAADDPNDLNTELQMLRALATKHGLISIFEQRGATLPGKLRGHEHFGFKDCISQPGVANFDMPDPNSKSVSGRPQVLGRPGTDIIASGEFILGEINETGGWLPVFDWMKNGSFQVFRRLLQDVPGFWSQIAAHIRSLPPDDTMDEELLGAKLVGRWKSGTPLDLAPDKDDYPTCDSKDENNFDFLNRDAAGNVIMDAYNYPFADVKGFRCPRFAHIRKVHPRGNNFDDNRNRRIIRRGIPFGLPFDPAFGGEYGADAQRGLFFVAFMANIEKQFEFVQQVWANSPYFPDGTAGPDPVIGEQQPRPSPVRLRREGRPDLLLDFQRFVHTTGALYAFVPSITTLHSLAKGTL